MALDQGFKFRSVPTETAGIFRSVPKTGTEHVIKNFALCTVCSGRNCRNPAGIRIPVGTEE